MEYNDQLFYGKLMAAVLNVIGTETMLHGIVTDYSI